MPARALLLAIAQAAIDDASQVRDAPAESFDDARASRQSERRSILSDSSRSSDRLRIRASSTRWMVNASAMIVRPVRSS